MVARSFPFSRRMAWWFLISQLQPALLKSVVLPGNAKTSLLYPFARSAVIILPPFTAVSVTMVQSLMAATMRLRTGKWCLSAFTWLINSVSRPPCFQICLESWLCSGGYMEASPWARTARVGSPCFNAFLWAMASIPKASPLTMVTSYGASSCIIFSVISFPYSVFRRVPTTETARSGFRLADPLKKRITGASSAHNNFWG